MSKRHVAVKLQQHTLRFRSVIPVDQPVRRQASALSRRQDAVERADEAVVRLACDNQGPVSKFSWEKRRRTAAEKNTRGIMTTAESTTSRSS